MWGPQNLKVEALVLDLVAAEVLGPSIGHDYQRKNAGEKAGDRPDAGARKTHETRRPIDPSEQPATS